MECTIRKAGPWISLLKFYLFIYFYFFRDRVPLHSPDYLRTHFVNQAGLEQRSPGYPHLARLILVRSIGMFGLTFDFTQIL